MNEPDDVPFDIAPEDRIPVDLTTWPKTIEIIAGICAGSTLLGLAAWFWLR